VAPVLLLIFLTTVYAYFSSEHNILAGKDWPTGHHRRATLLATPLDCGLLLLTETS